MNNRFYFFLFSIGCILFLLLFLVLSYYNRLAADDFYYLGGYSERGVWGCMRDLYFGYSGRWTAYLLTGFIIRLHSFSLFHFVFNVFTLLVLILILYSTIRIFFTEKLKLHLSIKHNLLFSLILSCSLFFSTYGIGETWFWLVQVCTYLWSIIMSLILLNVLLAEKFKAIHFPVIIISTVYIGGASESFALVNIFLLSACLFFSNTKPSSEWIPFPRSKNLNFKIILALLFLLISFTITMLAPGNEIRYNALPKVSFPETIWIQIKSFIKIAFIKTPLKLHYLLLLSFPWFILGKYLSDSNVKGNLLVSLSSLKKYFILILGFIFIFLIPISFIMSELGPDRALSQISFLITFGFAALFFFLGAKVVIKENVFNVLKFCNVLLFIAGISYHLINQYSITKKYAFAYDQRMEILQKLNKTEQENTIEVQPLPFSGMLTSAEISEDTSHFTNNFLEYALHLKFPVRKETEQE